MKTYRNTREVSDDVEDSSEHQDESDFGNEHDKDQPYNADVLAKYSPGSDNHMRTNTSLSLLCQVDSVGLTTMRLSGIPQR